MVWRHWGAPVDVTALAPLATTQPRATFSTDVPVPLALVPVAGAGWFGPAGLDCRRAGKPLVVRLSAQGVVCETDRLEAVLADEDNGLDVTVAAVAADDCMRFAVMVRNTGATALQIDRVASAVLPLSSSARTLISFSGRHNGELVEQRTAVPTHGWVREQRQGLTGHGGPPGLFVLGEGAGWHRGEVWALQLVWSGNHRILVEPDGAGGWTLLAEAVLGSGEITLLPGESFAAPEAITCFSATGRNGVIAAFHRSIRSAITWPGGTMRARPVHFNTWEGVYFEHDEARLGALAEAAARLGAERFVVDDGWFVGRGNDRAGLGDWSADPVRYPRGLAPLAEKVLSLGMEFGLWIEPEMVNPDSQLYRDHPEWVLGSATGAPLPEARHQLVLDLTLPEVREHLFSTLCDLLRDLPVTYLKWDHNRALAPAVTAQGNCGSHAQVLGAWALWDRIRASFPDIEIEACAAGGGRIDAGFAARAHRFWASDNIDATSRAAIQRGFLQFMPPELMGAHVGASPAHATGRSQALDFRALVALPGHFGIELNPERMGQQEVERLTHWVALYKRVRDRLHHGTCWLGEGADGLVWQAHGAPGDFLLLVTRPRPTSLAREAPLCLPMLGDVPQVMVRLIESAIPHRLQAPALGAMRSSGLRFSGSWLAGNGLPLPHLGGEGAALFEVRAA